MIKRSDDGCLEASISDNSEAQYRFHLSVLQLIEGNIMARVTIKLASGNYL